MKKKIALVLVVASCFGAANAQLMVDANGKTGVGIETYDTLYSQLAMNGRGENDVAIHINTQDVTGMKINRTGKYTSTTHYGLYVHNEPMGWENYGIYSRCKKGNSGNPSVSIGVGGLAQGATAGRCFGIAGFVGDPYGAGVFGSTSPSLGSISVNGLYAGYFLGDVYVTGTMNTPTLITPSDYRLKNDIKSVSSSCLDKVLDMNIVEFKYKQREFETIASTDSVEAKPAVWYDEESSIVKNKHYGLIAQELQEIYPDLVIEGQDGFLGVNYLEIIPILVRSIQELNAKVEQYENGNAPIMKAQARTTDVTNMDAVVTTLYQNTPNPFTESTLIRCDVAEDVAKADLYIYNMNGEQIAEYAVLERGATSITVDGGSLNPGMYLYALIADGQVVDTKRMILTK